MGLLGKSSIQGNPAMTGQAVLFLDVDGVLNTGRSRQMHGMSHVDAASVDALADFCQAHPHVVVVLSSTWRVPHLHKDTAGLVAALPFLARLPMHPDRPMTPLLTDGARGDEVLGWLDATGFTGAFAVLDDLSVDVVLPGHAQRDAQVHAALLRVDGRSGFGTPYHLDALRELLDVAA